MALRPATHELQSPCSARVDATHLFHIYDRVHSCIAESLQSMSCWTSAMETFHVNMLTVFLTRLTITARIEDTSVYINTSTRKMLVVRKDTLVY